MAGCSYVACQETLNLKGEGSRPLWSTMGKQRTYITNNNYCGHCEKDTPQEVHESGHERDSSGDWQVCLECGWRYSGLTGDWHPPFGEEEE